MKIIKYAVLASMLLSGSAFADREQAALDAQDMADALQRQADATDNASWDADIRAAEVPTTRNIINSWDQQDAADAAQDAADAAQEMADELSDY